MGGWGEGLYVGLEFGVRMVACTQESSGIVVTALMRTPSKGSWKHWHDVVPTGAHIFERHARARSPTQTLMLGAILNKDL